MDIDARDFKEVLGRFATGVTIVTTLEDGQPVGLTANSFSSVSLDPPLILFSLARSSTNFDAFMAADVFAVNILASGQDALSNRFAMFEGDRFDGVAWQTWATGAPILDGALAALDCRKHAAHDGGDHVILVGRVEKLAVVDAAAAPLAYYRGRYRSLSE